MKRVSEKRDNSSKTQGFLPVFKTKICDDLDLGIQHIIKHNGGGSDVVLAICTKSVLV